MNGFNRLLALEQEIQGTSPKKQRKRRNGQARQMRVYRRRYFNVNPATSARSFAQIGQFGQIPEGYLAVPVANMVRGIDVSHHNGTVNWTQVAGAGIVYAYMKATEGRTFEDPQFATNWAGSRAAGIVRGAYHVIREPSSSSVRDQAANFMNTVNHQRGDMPPALDVEFQFLERIINEQGVANAWQYLWTWCQEVERGTGYQPILYMSERGARSMNFNFGSLPSLELWMPRYRDLNNLPPLPLDARGQLVWPHWTFWQHSERGRVAGIGSAHVDLNVYNGDRNAFNTWVQTVQP